jgi:hypothetical protein
MSRSCMLLPNAVAALLPVPASSSAVTKLVLEKANMVTRILITLRALRTWVLCSTAH